AEPGALRTMPVAGGLDNADRVARTGCLAGRPKLRGFTRPRACRDSDCPLCDGTSGGRPYAGHRRTRDRERRTVTGLDTPEAAPLQGAASGRIRDVTAR